MLLDNLPDENARLKKRLEELLRKELEEIKYLEKQLQDPHKFYLYVLSVITGS